MVAVHRNFTYLLRMTASAAIVAAVALVCYYLPHHIDRVTVALLLLLSVVGIAMRWGMSEAVFAAAIGSLCLDYLFVPPYGFSLDSLPEWIAVVAFLAVAILTSRLSTQFKQKAVEATAREREMERLYAFGQVILQARNLQATIDQGLKKILEIFGGDGIAFHHLESDRIFRAGVKGGSISDKKLRRVSRDKVSWTDQRLGQSVVPMQLGITTIGSLGFVGTVHSEETVRALGQRLGVAIERARLIENESKAESARRTEELKSMVLDALAHGLKTPLTTIKVAATSLLSKNWDKAASTQELLQVIDEETVHLEQYIDEALQVARIDSGLLILEKGFYDVRSLIDSSIADMRVPLRDRAIEIQCPEDLPPLEFDFRILKLVLTELLTNAAKYSPPGSPLVIAARCQENAVTLSVTDSGRGIEKNEQSRIFERNYRGRDEMRRTPGSGLGLALAKSMVEAHHGKISVQSHSGQGTIFSISLPVSTEIVA
jgi:two-component system, OmpR family, sensor histidine kinase KdpD